MAAEHEHEAKASGNSGASDDFVRISKSAKDGKFYGEIVAPRGNLPDESVETLNQGYDNKADLLAIVAKDHPTLRVVDETRNN